MSRTFDPEVRDLLDDPSAAVVPAERVRNDGAIWGFRTFAHRHDVADRAIERPATALSDSLRRYVRSGLR